MTDKSKAPEFNLHKKPEPLPEAAFTLITDKEGVVSIEMRCGQHVTILGGLTMKEVKDLAVLLLERSQRDGLSALRAAQSRVNPFMGQYGQPFGRFLP